MKHLLNLQIILTLCFITACSHHNDVRPGTSGLHKVIITAEDKEEGAQEAIRQAHHYCKEEHKKSAAFEDEEQKYTGDMDEKTYKSAKTATKVVKAAGSSVFVFGKEKASDIGGIVGLGGGIADEALGKGYTVKMNFRCQ